MRRNIYKGVYLQRGSGIGTALSSLFRMLVPWIRRGATSLAKSPAVRRLAKRAGGKALKAAGSFAGDVVAGKNTKQSAKINLAKAQHGLEKAIKNFNVPEAKPKKRSKGPPGYKPFKRAKPSLIS